MINPDPLWIPPADREPLPTDPDLLRRIGFIYIDNTGAGQVAPGVRTVTYNGSPVPYRATDAEHGGCTFRVRSGATKGRPPTFGARHFGMFSRIGQVINGVPTGGRGVIIPDEQIGGVIDLLIENLAVSSDADRGVKEWSLVASRFGGQLRFGVCFWGTHPDANGEPTIGGLFGLVAAAADVEFAFRFAENNGENEVCAIWGPDGRFLGELPGGVFLEGFAQLNPLRQVASEHRSRATEARR